MGDSEELQKFMAGKRRVFMGRVEQADGVHYLPCAVDGRVLDDHAPSSACYCDPIGFFGPMVKVWAHRIMAA